MSISLMKLLLLLTICAGEMAFFSRATTAEDFSSHLSKLKFELTFDQFGFMLSRIHEHIVASTVKPLYEEADKLPTDDFLWTQFKEALGKGLKKLSLRNKVYQNHVKMAQSIERDVHKPLREVLLAFFGSEKMPEKTSTALKAKFAFLVLVDIGQKMTTKCLSLYERDGTRKMAIEWWKSFRHRISDITQVSPSSHLRMPLAQLCHLHRYKYANDESMFSEFALSKQLYLFRKAISIEVKMYYNGNQEELKPINDHGKTSSLTSTANPIEISVYKIVPGHSYTQAFHPAIYFDKTEIHFIQNGIWLRQPGSKDTKTMEHLGLRTLLNIKTRVKPEELQQILDQWEIEGKFRHGAHSHVERNCVDFVLDLIGEIHTEEADDSVLLPAGEFPPKQVEILEKRRNAKDQWDFEPVGGVTTVQWPPAFLKQTPWIEWNRTGLSSHWPIYNQIEKWIIGQISAVLAKRRD